MSVRSYCRRLVEMTWQDRILLVETTAALAVASLAIRLLPFRKVVGALSVPKAAPTTSGDSDRAAIARTRWAVEACARLVPWRTVCFQKGLAMYWLLSRRQIHSQLHYGVAQNASEGLKAHVWLTFEGVGIIGEDQAPDFTCLATFPAPAAGGGSKSSAAGVRNR